MKSNIKYMWAKIKNSLDQLYKQIKKSIPLKKIIMYLDKMPSLHRVKPVHGALVLALAAGAAFYGLSSPNKMTPDKSTAQLRVLNDKESSEVKESSSGGGISQSDRYLLARVIEGEAADEPMKGKVAVGAVILNRTESKDFPHDISQVVYQPLAFEAVSNGQYNRPLTPEALKAADLALEGWDPTSGALYYWNPAKASSDWIWQKPVTMQIGRHVFAR